MIKAEHMPKTIIPVDALVPARCGRVLVAAERQREEPACPKYAVHFGGSRAVTHACTLREGHSGECSFGDLLRVGGRE